jgi:hypothetical protein
MAAGENVFDCRSVVWGPRLQVSRVWRVGEQAEGGGVASTRRLDASGRFVSSEMSPSMAIERSHHLLRVCSTY